MKKNNVNHRKSDTWEIFVDWTASSYFTKGYPKLTTIAALGERLNLPCWENWRNGEITDKEYKKYFIIEPVKFLYNFKKRGRENP